MARLRWWRQRLLLASSGCLASALQQPTLVALAGGSGAGKSFLATALKKAFGQQNVAHLSHDWYYRDQRHLPLEKRGQLNWDHPGALESLLLAAHLQSLKRGEAVEAPVYDFETHTRSRRRFTRVIPAPLVLVDGVLLLAEKLLADAFDIRVFVDAPEEVRFRRRIRRDVAERGRTAQSVEVQYRSYVRPMHLLFVEPSRSRADLVVSSTERGPSTEWEPEPALLRRIEALTGLEARPSEMQARLSEEMEAAEQSERLAEMVARLPEDF